MSTELIRLIHQDAEEWCALDQETQHERFVYWYSHHANAVAAAFASAPGHKMVVTVPTMLGFDSIASRLTSFADIIAVRDAKGPIKGEPACVAIPDERSHKEQQRVSQLDALLNQVDVGSLPLIGMELPWYWSSSEKTLNDGRIAHKAVAMNDMCHWNKDVYDWWSSSSLTKNGQTVFTPFMPTSELEAVAIGRDFSIYALYGAFPLSIGRDDRIEYNNLRTLLDLEIPHFRGTDPETLKKAQEDLSVDFDRSRDAVLSAVLEVKELAGDEGYERKVRRIRREVIDDPLNTLRTKMNSATKLKSMSDIQAVVAISATALLAGIGAPASVLVGGVGATLIQLVESIKARTRLKQEITEARTNPMFFLWQMEKKIKR